MNHRKGAGTAAAAGDGTARSLHALSTVAAAGCEILRDSQEEVGGALIQNQREGRITDRRASLGSGEGQPGEGEWGEAGVAPPVMLLLRLAVTTTQDRHHGWLVFFPSSDPIQASPSTTESYLGGS